MDHSVQLLILVAIIAAVAALIYAEVTTRKRKKRKRSPSNSSKVISRSGTTYSQNYKYSTNSIDSLNSLATLDHVLEGIGVAYRELKDETSIMAVEYEPLESCPAKIVAERCARFSWKSAGGLINRTLLPPIEAFGQECF